MKLDKKQADRLLRALERKEEELQDKYQKKKFETKSDGKKEKDW